MSEIIEQLTAELAALRQQNAELLGQARQRAAELAIIHSVGQALASHLDTQSVIELVGDKIREVFDAQAVQIILYDRETNLNHFRYFIEQGERRTLDPVPLGQGFTSHIIQTRQPLVINQQMEAWRVRLGARPFARTAPKSYLGVPIAIGERVVGVIALQNLDREQAFGDDDLRLLATMAASMGVAIENARLFEEVQRQKQYFESLVQNSPVAIVSADFSGKVTSWNPAAEKLFGYAQAEALGRNIDELVTTEVNRAEAVTFSLQAMSGSLIHTITRRSRKDGSPVDVELLAVPVVVDGPPVGYIAIYHDITELQQARKAAEAANQAKSAFLAMMSHEIRTPLNAIIGMSGLLLNTKLTPQQKEFAEITRNSSEALLAIINDILDFSKIEASRLELENQPFDLRECIESAFDLIGTRAWEKGLDLAYFIDEGVPAAIVGDMTRLRQIILNLLSNAVKFTDRGEVVLSVSSEQSTVNGEPSTVNRQPVAVRGEWQTVHRSLFTVHFAVRDTGIGIPRERMDRLFQSFSQVDASTMRKYGGTGLGLAISKRLSEMMGGTMWLESEGVPGKGSTFHFTIRAEAVPSPTRVHLSGTQPKLSGKHALIVDDNATNRRILTLQMQPWGMITRDTGSPLEALEWIRRGDPFDVAMLDLQMPEMDGLMLAHEIRRIETARRAVSTMPLVMLSSLGRPEAAVEAKEFAAILMKPIKSLQLYEGLMSIFAEPFAPARETFATQPPMARNLPLRILLAEDNAVNQKLALLLLEPMGYRADVVGNGLEAIQALRRQPYDVVLMDVQMPEMDGLEASRRICQLWPREQRPRIIAMTANAMQEDRETALAAGMDDYVSKPIRSEELITALSQCRPLGTGADTAPPSRAPEATAPSMPPTETEEAALDVAALNRLRAMLSKAPPGALANLIDTFLSNAPQLLHEMNQAAQRGQADDLRRAAHTLKSNAANFGAIPLSNLCRALEAIGKSGTVEGAAPLIARIADEYQRVKDALKAMRDA